MKTNCVARARIVNVARMPGMSKVQIAFGVQYDSEKGKYVFPREASCDFVSGFIATGDDKELMRVYSRACEILRTDNIEFV